jgi:hypothetical protein
MFNKFGKEFDDPTAMQNKINGTICLTIPFCAMKSSSAQGIGLDRPPTQSGNHSLS